MSQSDLDMLRLGPPIITSTKLMALALMLASYCAHEQTRRMK